MKRIWVGKGLDGLLTRREREAALFERGLKAAPASVLHTKTAHAAAGSGAVGAGVAGAVAAAQPGTPWWAIVAIIVGVLVLGIGETHALSRCRSSRR
jgi:hypothetical protein